MVVPIHTVLHPSTGTNVDLADAHAAKHLDERLSTVSYLHRKANVLPSQTKLGDLNWPGCTPQAVEELLCALRAPGDTPVPVPSWHYEEDEPRQANTMLLQDALTLCYDLRRAHLLEFQSEMYSDTRWSPGHVSKLLHGPLETSCG